MHCLGLLEGQGASSTKPLPKSTTSILPALKPALPNCAALISLTTLLELSIETIFPLMAGPAGARRFLSLALSFQISKILSPCF